MDLAGWRKVSSCHNGDLVQTRTQLLLCIGAVIDGKDLVSSRCMKGRKVCARQFSFPYYFANKKENNKQLATGYETGLGIVPHKRSQVENFEESSLRRQLDVKLSIPASSCNHGEETPYLKPKQQTTSSITFFF